MPKNTEVPAKIEVDGFSTMQPFQSKLQITVTQGEFEDVNATLIIGDVILDIRPRDCLVPIKFIVSCDANAMIHVEAYDMADEIFVINVGGYIGSSTRSEIEYAKANGRKVNYLEPVE